MPGNQSLVCPVISVITLPWVLFVVVIAVLAVKLPDSRNSEWCVVKIKSTVWPSIVWLKKNLRVL